MKYLLTLFGFVLFVHSYAQEHYSSDLEKEIILEYQKDSLNYNFIASLSAIDSSVSEEDAFFYAQKIDELIKGFPPKEEKEKREGKRIEKIYDEVHDAFFRKYQDIAYFPQIFQDGVYNCVTATALYAYVFDKIDVPYQVKNVPSHVYLVAYPNTQNIYLETTVPGSYGFSNPKQSDIDNAVKDLMKLKLVSQDEVRDKGINKVYMDYFFGKDFVEKAALVGMQYYNKALQDIGKEDYQNASRHIKKSLIFYPYAPSKMIEASLVGYNLKDLKLETMEDIETLYDTYNNLEFGEDFNKDDIRGYIYDITRNDNTTVFFVEEAAQKLARFENAELNDFITENFYDYLASVYSDKGDLEEAIRSSDSILKVNPDSKRAKNIIEFAVGKKMFALPNDEESLKIFDNYSETYSFIEDNLKVEAVKAYMLNKVVVDNVQRKKVTQAETYLERLETLIDKHGGDLPVNIDALTYMYLRIGRYYYGKQQNSKALRHFKKGREFDPNDPELKKMIRWVNEDRN